MDLPWKLPMKKPPVPELPILMLTAVENAMEIAHCFDDFRTKHGDFQELRKKSSKGS